MTMIVTAIIAVLVLLVSISIYAKNVRDPVKKIEEVGKGISLTDCDLSENACMSKSDCANSGGSEHIIQRCPAKPDNTADRTSTPGVCCVPR